jgi:asparagine synthase (glutamine-hydrolysing)
MCGIAGYRGRASFAQDVLPQMLAALVHRGPDAAGIYQDGDYVAGMRRLSINDLASGDQPLFNEDRSVALLYNGEIYNAPEIRERLEAKGYRFRTHSDGEVICHLYAEYGDDLFEHLDGMFAAALWIVPERRLILARDLPGEKPLYYAMLNDGGLAFASEIKSLKRCPGIDLALNRQALWDYPTFLWIPEPATVYSGIQALPRGHLLISDADGGCRIRAFANRWNTNPLSDDSAEGIAAETRRVVEQAVDSRLLSDVSIGSFLSGGLDSSIVAALATRKLGPIDTFTIGFEDVDDPYHGRSDESADAAEFARLLGTRHHTIRVAGRDFRDLLDTFIAYGDQPFAVSSGLGILAISRAAHRAGLKVLLSGDGADECFGGYSWYYHLNEADRSGAIRDADAIVSFQNTGRSVPERLARLAAMPSRERAWAWHYYAHEREKANLFAPDWADGLTSSLRHFEEYDPAPAWSAEGYVAQDRAFYFPNEMMRKLDRMTMAFSIEGRLPFAAPSVLAHADKLRYRHMVRDGQLKWALRNAFNDVLPQSVRARPKHGFNVPIDHWLKNDWSDLLDEAFASGSALHRHGLLQGDARATAERMLYDQDRLNGHTLFCFITLNRWLEQEFA